MNTISSIEEKILNKLNDKLSYLVGNIGNIKFDNLFFLKRVKMLETLHEDVIIEKIWEVVDNIKDYNNINLLENYVFEEKLQTIFDIMERTGNMNKPRLEHIINNTLRNIILM
jgi:hypothetical protein